MHDEVRFLVHFEMAQPHVLAVESTLQEMDLVANILRVTDILDLASVTGARFALELL